MSTPAQADRNLLGGVLALQMDFVTGEQLLAAMNAWTLRKETPLLDVLRQDGVLSGDDHDALSRLVERHLARHDGDAQKSLAAVHLEPRDRRQLQQVEDSELQSSLDGMRMATPPVGGMPQVASTGAGGPADSGVARFRRVVSHARGGLGEVWLAEDTELHRQVALKEIQSQFADYEDSRTRFIREAEITGQLEHPGVVPIYGLGVYGNGRPYYAMRFIRGESMQEAIDRFHEADRAGKRDPGERALALRGLLGRFVAVCNAVGFAHAQRVIHRDLKPANVMLGEYGETLVVDWGVARRMSEDENRTRPTVSIHLSQDTEQTQEGQAIGTPAFMPPEQALGELERVGPASDIFSLGATLYQLLTGKPPYCGTGLLLQAAECQFPAPRQVNPAVPAALEAVCLRAMASSPEGRYARAVDLAGDVDRWLADEPVSAYSEPWMPRVGRWARRNRTLVSSLAVLLLASVTALSVGLVAVGHEQTLTAQALNRAQDAEGEAKGNLIQAEENLGRAVEAEARATGNLKRAEENLKLARKAVDECFNIAKNYPRFQEESLKDVKRVLLEKALPFYKNFRAQRPDDSRLDEETAEQFFRVAYITDEIGSKEEALVNYRQSCDIRTKIVAVRPDVLDFQINLGITLNNLGSLLFALGKRDEALDAFHKALDIDTKLAKARPNVSRHQLSLAKTQINLGNLLSALDKRAEAMAAYQKALDIVSELAAAEPDVSEYKSLLATTQLNLGILLSNSSKLDEALLAYRKALDLQTELATKQPNGSKAQSLLATTHASLAALLADLGKPDEALVEYRKALDIQDRLAATLPDISDYQHRAAGTHYNLGNLLKELRRYDEAMADFQKARDIWLKLVAAQPKAWEYQSSLALTHKLLGIVYSVSGERKKSLEAFRRARDLWLGLVAAQPNVAVHQSDLATTHLSVGILLNEMGKPKEALEACRKALDLQVRLVSAKPDVLTYQRDLGSMHHSLATWSSEPGTWDKALEAYRRALDIRIKLAAAQPKNLMYQNDLANTQINMGTVFHASGKPEEALASYRSARENYRRCAVANPANTAFPFAMARADFLEARSYAVLVARVREKADMPLAQRTQEAEKLASEAIHSLKRAKAKGLFAVPRWQRSLGTDPDFASIRDRADFKAFLATLPKVPR